MADGGEDPSNLLVIFGITGDLARKMTYRALYRLESRDLLDCPIVGVASDDMTKEKLVEQHAAALTGDRQLFAREDAIEETWRTVQPVLDKLGRIHHYDPGSWGPEAAQSLLHGHRRRQDPWLPHGTHPKQ